MVFEQGRLERFGYPQEPSFADRLFYGLIRTAAEVAECHLGDVTGYDRVRTTGARHLAER